MDASTADWPEPDAYTMELLTKNYSKRVEDKLTKDEKKHLIGIRSSVSPDLWRHYESLGRAAEKRRRREYETANTTPFDDLPSEMPVAPFPVGAKLSSDTTVAGPASHVVATTSSQGSSLPKPDSGALLPPNVTNVASPRLQSRVGSVTHSSPTQPALHGVPLLGDDMLAGTLFVSLGDVVVRAARSVSAAHLHLLPVDSWLPRFVSMNSRELCVWEDQAQYMAAGGEVGPLLAVELSTVSVIMGTGALAASREYSFRLIQRPALTGESIPSNQELPLLRCACDAWPTLSAWYTALSKYTFHQSRPDGGIVRGQSFPVSPPFKQPTYRLQGSIPLTVPVREEEQTDGTNTILPPGISVDYSKQAALGHASSSAFPASFPSATTAAAEAGTSPSPGQQMATTGWYAKRLDVSQAIGRVSDLDYGVGTGRAGSGSSEFVVRQGSAALDRSQRPPLATHATGGGQRMEVTYAGHSNGSVTVAQVAARLLVPTESWKARGRAREEEEHAKAAERQRAIDSEEAARRALSQPPRSASGGTRPAALPRRPAAATIMQPLQSRSRSGSRGQAVGMRGFAAQLANVQGRDDGSPSLLDRSTDAAMAGLDGRTRYPGQPYVPNRMDVFHRAQGIPAPSSSLQSFVYHSGYERPGWHGSALGGPGAAITIPNVLSEGSFAAPTGHDSSRLSFTPFPGFGSGRAGSPARSASGAHDGRSNLNRTGSSSAADGPSTVAVPVLTSLTQPKRMGSPRHRGRGGGMQDMSMSTERTEVVATRALSPGVKRKVMWQGQAWPVVQAEVFGTTEQVRHAAEPDPLSHAQVIQPVVHDPLSSMLLEHIAAVEAALKSSEAERARMAHVVQQLVPERAERVSAESTVRVPARDSERRDSAVVDHALMAPEQLSSRLSSLAAVARSVRQGLESSTHEPAFRRTSVVQATAAPASVLAHSSALSDSSRSHRQDIDQAATARAIADAANPAGSLQSISSSLTALQASMQDLSSRLVADKVAGVLLGHKAVDQVTRQGAATPLLAAADFERTLQPHGDSKALSTQAWALVLPRTHGLPGTVLACTSNSVLCSAELVAPYAAAGASAAETGSSVGVTGARPCLLRYHSVFTGGSSGLAARAVGTGGPSLLDSLQSMKFDRALLQSDPRGHASVLLLGAGPGISLPVLCDVGVGPVSESASSSSPVLLHALLTQAFEHAMDRYGSIAGDGTVSATVHAVLVSSGPVDGRVAMYDVLLPASKRQAGSRPPRLSIPHGTSHDRDMSLTASRLWCGPGGEERVWVTGAMGVRVQSDVDMARVTSVLGARLRELLASNELTEAGWSYPVRSSCCLLLQVDMNCMGVPAGRLVLALLPSSHGTPGGQGGGGDPLLREHVLRQVVQGTDVPSTLSPFEQLVLPSDAPGCAGLVLSISRHAS